MLIESACSVDRVEEALSTLLPMLPEMQYYRFNPGMIPLYGYCIKSMDLFLLKPARVASSTLFLKHMYVSIFVVK